MSFNNFISPSAEADFVALGATRTGRLFRKHILNKGPLLHPATGKVIDIDDDFVSKMVNNFSSGVCDIVQVPVANDKNEHVEDPLRNIGQVVGIEEEDGKVYALIDARKHSEDLGKTMLGASAMLSLDYTNTKTGEKVGPTLLHVAVTNRPYVTGLEEYEEIVAASDYSVEGAVLLTPAPTETLEHTEEVVMTTVDEAIAFLKENGIDVAALQVAAEKPAEDVNLSALVEALKDNGVIKLSNGDSVTSEDVVGAVAQLAKDKVELSNRITALETDKLATAAGNEVDSLIAAGKVIPAKRDAMVKLYLSNKELFDALVPDAPVVKLSNEEGVTPPDEAPEADVDADIARYAKLAADLGTKVSL